MPNTTTDLHSLVDDFVANLERSVRETINARVSAALADLSTALHHIAPVTRAAPATKASPVRAPAIPVSGRSVRLCPVPGCGKPAAGPKYQWRCREHGVLKTGKTIVAKATAATPAALPAPKAAAPRAPASAHPSAAQRGVAHSDPTICRFPGCRTKHSGPRYDLFCREHYATVSADDRAKYKQQWKAAQAPTA